MLNNLYWKLFRPRQHQDTLAKVMAASPRGLDESWYYHIDFGDGVEVRPNLKNQPDAGLNNWRDFLRPNLPDLTGKRVLNIGCNAGLYDLEMIDCGARETVGIDWVADQAEFVRDWFTARRNRDYSKATFIQANAPDFDFKALGQFDLVTMFCVAYHLGDAIDHIMAQLSDMTPMIALQGNLPRLTGKKYADRQHQHLAGIDGMSDLLLKHGYDQIAIAAPPSYSKPLVVGAKST